MTSKRQKIFGSFFLITILAIVLTGCKHNKKPKSTQETIQAAIIKMATIPENKILYEKYELIFDDPLLNQTRAFYEDPFENIKVITPYQVAVRKNNGGYFDFIGHDTKNNYYDKFKIKQKSFEKSLKTANAVITINSFTSRGVTMYTSYGPDDFWPHILRVVNQPENRKITQNKNVYIISNKLNKNDRIKLTFSKKNLLPIELELKTKPKKTKHCETTFNKVIIKVKERKYLPLSKAPSIFNIDIPSNFKVTTYNIKQHQEGLDENGEALEEEEEAEEKEEHEEEDKSNMGLGEEVCNSCHFKDFRLQRFTKK